MIRWMKTLVSTVLLGSMSLRKRSRVWVYGLALLVSLLALTMTACEAQGATRWGEEQKLVASAWTYVDRAYVDPDFNDQDWWAVRRQILSQPLPSRDATYRAIEQMLDTLGDPFTRFLDREHYQSLQTSTAGELSGVGLQITIDESDQIRVIAPIEGSPAQVAGVISGDRILAIDGDSLQGLSLDAVAERMRGPLDSQVELTLQRQEDPIFTVTLTRAAIAINPVRLSLVPDLIEGYPLAYIRLNQFNGNATQQLQDAIRKAEAQQAGAYILDLRNNPGGLLQAAIEIGQLWMPGGTIVLVTDRNGIQEAMTANAEVLTEAPLVVLVNQGSASASEVLAGALQDNGRAILVGTRTFGKALIQSLFRLEDGSGLAVTTAKYLTPNGRDINRQGIEPDWVVELPESEQILAAEQLATEADIQFLQAVHILQRQMSQPESLATTGVPKYPIQQEPISLDTKSGSQQLS